MPPAEQIRVDQSKQIDLLQYLEVINVPCSHNDLTIDFFFISNCKIGINEHNKTIHNNKIIKIKILIILKLFVTIKIKGN